jgi:hypothetical protein
MKRLLPFTLPFALLLGACDAAERGADATATAATPASAAAATAPPVETGNVVRMRVDGVAWQADREFFCAVHPPGMDRAVLVSASLGPKDANEQTFNLNLSGVDGPGRVHLQSSASWVHTIQLANLDAARFLNGGAMGFDITVELLAVSADPVRVEARFEGSLMSSAGSALRIEDGYLRCSE